MLARFKRFLRRKAPPSERLSLTNTGFQLWSDDSLKGQVVWDEVDQIVAFKDDLLTIDLICIEFIVGARQQVFEINEDVKGFWDVVERVKELFPDSLQDWETRVVKPAFERNPTVIFRRAGSQSGSNPPK